MSKSGVGICKLTGTTGPFVKSHILPAALTKPAYPGAMLFQHVSGRRAQKRRTSWYDQTMVCAEGEKILSDLDDWGIKFLRRERLIWSGFGPVRRIEPDASLSGIGPELSDYGLRKIQLECPEILRKFFLSLLWRAANSRLPEMNEVQLGRSDAEKLTSYLVGQEDLPLAFFPCWLIQHHQVGFSHNQSPTKQVKTFQSVLGSPERSVNIYRFYFDGLVAHFHELNKDNDDQIAKNALTIGYGKELAVYCVPWSRSAQLENIMHVSRESLW